MSDPRGGASARDLPAAGSVGNTRVVLDANALVEGGDPSSPRFASVLDAARAHKFNLYVPEIAIREAVGVRRRHLFALRDGVRTAERKAGQIVQIASDLADLDTTAESYGDSLRAALGNARATILPTPNIPHDQLVDRAIARRPPFTEGKGGYRDSLIWFSVIAEVVHSSAVTFLVTRDRGFMDDHRNLHGALAEDLELAGHRRNAVQILDRGLDDIRHTLLTSAGRVTESVKALLSSKEFRDRTVKAIESLVPGHSVVGPTLLWVNGAPTERPYGMPWFLDEPTAPTAIAIAPPETIEVNDARFVTPDITWVELRLPTDVFLRNPANQQEEWKPLVVYCEALFAETTNQFVDIEVTTFDRF